MTRKSVLVGHGGMLGGAVVLGKLDDPTRIRASVELALREPGKVACIRLQSEVPPEGVLTQALRHPNDSPTLGLARVTVMSLGWSRRA